MTAKCLYSINMILMIISHNDVTYTDSQIRAMRDESNSLCIERVFKTFFKTDTSLLISPSLLGYLITTRLNRKEACHGVIVHEL